MNDAEVTRLYGSGLSEIMTLLKVDKSTAEQVKNKLGAIDPADEEARLADAGGTYLTLADDGYPRLLRQLYDPPMALFIKGKLGPDEPGVAVVGARCCTAYGRSVAEQIADDLAVEGVTVISGLARGIDAAAHRGALRTGRTIAVLGSGLDRIYPPEHEKLADRITDSGAIVSEYPLGTPPLAINFPARNRIISGLAAAVLIVEAAKRSGALITVDFALEQGKEVLVVPGSVRSPASAGCLNLLKQGAAPATEAADILWAIGREPNPAGAGPPSGQRQSQSTSHEQQVLEKVGFEKTHIDTILAGDGRGAKTVMAELTLLELDGTVSREPGGWFTRVK